MQKHSKNENKDFMLSEKCSIKLEIVKLNLVFNMTKIWTEKNQNVPWVWITIIKIITCLLMGRNCKSLKQTNLFGTSNVLVLGWICSYYCKGKTSKVYISMFII